MVIESKEKMRARGIRSPDRAEALMLALSRPPQKYEYIPVRRSVSPTGGRPYEDEDRPRSRREQLEAVFGRLGRWRGF